MKWCVTFPEEDVILVSRRSLRLACGGNGNAGGLLSHLLYRVSIRKEAEIEAKTINEVKEDQGQAADQDLNSTTIKRTQAQILQGMDNDFSDRTLRDDAIPCLVELEYIIVRELKGNKNYSEYTLNLEKIQDGISHSEKVPSYKAMNYYRKKFRAEKLPNDATPRSENIPSGKTSAPVRKNFRAGSEKLPRRFGKTSERELACEDAPQAAPQGVFLSPKSIEENIKEEGKEESPPTSALPEEILPSFLPSDISFSSLSQNQETLIPDHLPEDPPQLPPQPVQSPAQETAPESCVTIPTIVTQEIEPIPPTQAAIEAQPLHWIKRYHVVKARDKAKVAEQIAVLSCLTSEEQFKSLYEHTVAHIAGANKTVYLGNLVSCLDAWKQAVAPKAEARAEAMSNFISGVGYIPNLTYIGQRRKPEQCYEDAAPPRVTERLQMPAQSTRRGMLKVFAEELAGKIRCDMPTARVDVAEVSPRHWAARVKCASGLYVEFWSAKEYSAPTPEVRTQLDHFRF